MSVRCLGQEDPLEKEMITHSKYSCLGNLMDRGAWWSIFHAAAAAKSLQLCPTLCNPTDSSPPGSPIPGILQARTLEWIAISFSSA